MSQWRKAFEEDRPSREDVEYKREYTFGPPATEEQLAQAEQRLGAPLPVSLRELLREFNGIWYTTKYDRERGYEASMCFLDTEKIPGVLDVLVDSGNDIPPVDDLKKVAFFWQSNGYAVLYGVCLEDIAEFEAGAVVYLDHEHDALLAAYPDLLSFVRQYDK